MKTFAESLDMWEIIELSGILYEIKVRYYRDNARSIHSDEMTLVDNGYYIDAIKEYRRRSGSSLLEAKTVIDVYKNR